MVKGLTSNVSYQYDSANRLTTAGGQAYTFDANGNLLNDGQNTYAYDSANRLSSVSSGQSTVSSYQYSGLGDRLSQDGVNYTLDLNAELTQVLSDGTNTYTYGLGRISQTNTNTEYFLGDALGSVRQLVNNAGEVTLTKSYDPYGNVVSSTGSGSSAYAYTGEQQDASGLTYLRARYYNPLDGRFISRDTWDGNYNSPQSLNRWNYVGGNPVNLTDPSGRFPEWCKSMGDRIQYEDCVRRHYGLSASIYHQVMPPDQQGGTSGCWNGPVAYKAPGYLEGYSIAFSFGASYSRGTELVFDFGTMEKGLFNYETAGITIEAGISVMEYHGVIAGFNNIDTIDSKYKGSYMFFGGGVNTGFPGLNLGVGAVGFASFDGELRGVSEYYSIGGGVSLIPGLSLAGGVGISNWHPGYQKQSYILNDGRANLPLLIQDITLDPDSPARVPVPSNLVKMLGIELATYYSWIYDEIHVNSK